MCDVYTLATVNKKEKRVSNCLNTVYRVLRSLTDILIYSCYDNTLSLSMVRLKYVTIGTFDLGQL